MGLAVSGQYLGGGELPRWKEAISFDLNSDLQRRDSERTASFIPLCINKWRAGGCLILSAVGIQDPAVGPREGSPCIITNQAITYYNFSPQRSIQNATSQQDL